jgi:hypothetical protein
VEQADLLKVLVGTLEKIGVPYLLTGSLATSAFGEPRFTHDIDVVVRLTLAQVPQLCAAFLRDGADRRAIARSGDPPTQEGRRSSVRHADRRPNRRRKRSVRSTGPYVPAAAWPGTTSRRASMCMFRAIPVTSGAVLSWRT